MNQQLITLFAGKRNSRLIGAGLVVVIHLIGVGLEKERDEIGWRGWRVRNLNADVLTGGFVRTVGTVVEAVAGQIHVNLGIIGILAVERIRFPCTQNS